jgi:hypothetical protein|tara:strand:+ start:146 stop:364 length:219 start_codon:yes stop_codon:yes gene_type:complete
MPFLNGTKEQNKFLFDFCVLCNKHFIDEHIALQNENIKKQFAVKENPEIKLKKIEKILLKDFKTIFMRKAIL